VISHDPAGGRSIPAPGIRLLDSVTELDPEEPVGVVVSGSHGGVYAAALAASSRARAVVLSDAGVGKDGAGVAGLAYCAARGMPAATVSHATARIGDARDAWERGIVSRVNVPASRLGCAPGLPCATVARRLTAAPERAPAGHREEETRRIVTVDTARVLCVGSASLVRPEDAGWVIATGSHGGLVGGDPGRALGADAALALFNDAGVGIDEAGIGRLPVLDRRGVPAATVAASSARIGDGMSTLEDGIVSHVNEAAARLGAVPGMPARRLVRLLARPRGR